MEPMVRRTGWVARHLEEVLLVVAAAVNACVFLAHRFFPYQDYINHVARYTLIERVWRGDPVAGIEVRFVPSPYGATDAVGAALVWLGGPSFTLAVVVLAAMLLPPAGMYALLRQVDPRQRGWALIGTLFSFSWYFMIGYLNYVIGVGLALLWLAAWWPRRASLRPRDLGLLSAGIAGVFLVHLSAPLIALGVVGVDYALAAWRERGRLGWARALRRPELGVLVTATATVGVLWVSAWLSTSSGAHVPPVHPGITRKIERLAAPFYSFSAAQMAVMAGAYLVALVALLRSAERRWRLETFTAASLLFVLLYTVSPRDAAGAGDVDVRWLMAVYLLPFCAAAPHRRPAPALLCALTVACVGHAAVVWRQANVIERELRDYARVLRMLPPETRVLPLVTDGRRHGRVSPYLHFALWHVIQADGRVPGLFNEFGQRDGDPINEHFGHFRIPVHRYYPLDRWGFVDFTPLDWPRIGREYDFVVQAGRDPQATRAIAAGAEERVRVGDVTLYTVRRPAAGGPAAVAVSRRGEAGMAAKMRCEKMRCE
jgi:hypothetical protein